MWMSVVNVVLVEGKNLNVGFNATVPPDAYCKFKLGCEKYKSKVSDLQRPNFLMRELRETKIINIASG